LGFKGLYKQPLEYLSSLILLNFTKASSHTFLNNYWFSLSFLKDWKYLYFFAGGSIIDEIFVNFGIEDCSRFFHFFGKGMTDEKNGFF